ncbi:ATP-binding protein [Actinoplanes aureus]|uniref:Sensor-like histidine kinase SenX3 n=1 Tax=Actinoplanes aureus TaxID=2792083 RepID=A0A931CCG2_9ACTN|nr:ATP-binding protein [Actinoplanes aureus]MBG0564801.1 CHASE3 domain-containing protein [Actinoplanes aureus]
MNVQRRLNLGFAALFLLFVVFLVVPVGLGERHRAAHERDIARIGRAQLANGEVLQRMTDAETGVRGFQLTGERLFLEPYETGAGAAETALGQVAAHTRDEAVRQLLAREREAVRAWLDEYATPIVTAGVADADEDRATRGKLLFDELRLVNDAVAAAIDAERWDADRAAAGTAGLFNGLAVALVTAILVVGCAVARTGRRQLLAPLGRLGDTIRRLAAGDRSARAEPVGAAELRTVIEALNDLAAQTETLLAAEQARSARAGLRQAVVAELQELRDPAASVRRIAALIGAAAGADTVHSEICFPATGPITVHWPAGAAEPPADVIAEVLAGPSGRPVIRPGGGFAVKLGDSADSEPGYLLVTRSGAAWGDAEHRLLAGAAREIERALHQLTFQRYQDRLISELRMLDQRKDVFIQTVTHELRTPLTSILGYTEMIVEEEGRELDPLQKRALNAILRNAHRLQDIIGDLILLDRPDSDTPVESDVLDLAGIATVVHGELNNFARAKELEVDFEAGEAWVRGDRTQLRRALRKLMENAIKFTPAGGSVSWQLTADDHTVALSVTDTGIGIPAEDVPGLFTPFHRAGNAMDQAVQGPGLGLAIVRDIVRDHGGSIAVQSVVGRGSTFTITLPAAPAPVPA